MEEPIARTRHVHAHVSMSANRTDRFDRDLHRSRKLPENPRGSRPRILPVLLAAPSMVAGRRLACRPTSGRARKVNRSSAEAAPCRGTADGELAQPRKRVRHPCASECLRKSFRSVTGERSPPLDNLAKALHDPPIRTAQRSHGCVRHALSRRHLCFRFLACPGVLSRSDRGDGRHAGVAPGQSSAKRLTARSSSRRIERDPIARFILFVGSRYCTVGPGNFGEGSERA
jgi:hypothetical protein